MVVFVKFAGLFKFPLSSKNSFFPFSFWLAVATWQYVLVPWTSQVIDLLNMLFSLWDKS